MALCAPSPSLHTCGSDFTFCVRPGLWPLASRVVGRVPCQLGGQVWPAWNPTLGLDARWLGGLGQKDLQVHGRVRTVGDGAPSWPAQGALAFGQAPLPWHFCFPPPFPFLFFSASLCMVQGYR